MADDADIASDFIDNEVSRALGRIRQDLQPKSGSEECGDCGEKIPDARRTLGFSLCIECASESERRKSLFADY